ncbi:cobalt-precorrin-8 methylmutase [Brenneria rubrifaciens]|uniref:Cobalt-precorrin-8 methylmutase n=1 Tax=Brenneria rubrifaciens TaxID=55213 RepID=A0A4P8QXP2_9GAMM|nr:cobalt-precorrin-8 methylmutase [Brenneria rubrifaciens]QCR08184.1 cobalt-precorrin-8 methylmutase [Brenneria rubrifaciens]
MNYLRQPRQIEQQSFEIISDIIARERPGYRFADRTQEAIIKRVIHTTADFDWLDILWFSSDALARIQAGLRAGCILYTDTTMALSGINKTLLAQLGCECRCFISDPRAVARAKAENITRAMAAVDIALEQQGEKLFVFGNAPTALFRLLERRAAPLAAIGVPVGFVGAAESKDALFHSDIPCIASAGRKGGSNVAAAIVNAILYRIREEL